MYLLKGLKPNHADSRFYDFFKIWCGWEVFVIQEKHRLKLPLLVLYYYSVLRILKGFLQLSLDE
jgi:hypothetical protein